MAVQYFILLAALSNLGSVLAAPSGARIRDAVPNYPVYPDTTPYCSWWWDNDGSISCEEMPDAWGFTWDDFVRWNPSLAAGCTAYRTSMSFCVEARGEPPVSTTAKPTTSTSTGPPSTRSSSTSSSSSSSAVRTTTSTATTSTSTSTSTSTTPTSTKPTNGIETPSPTQPGMVDNCDAFYKVVTGDSCDSIAAKNGISVEQFRSWNTNIGGTACNGLWADAYVCVLVIGHTPTPTNPGNGIATPSPTQPGMVSNCDAFYKVVTGDSCDSIAAKNGITAAQLSSWNNVGTACNGLWVDAYVCVSIVGHTPTPTNPGNGIATPSPTQPGMISNCDAFYKVVTGDSCDNIASKNGITVAQLSSWNNVGTGCSGLWANAYVCVSIIGHTPTPTNPGNGIVTPSPTQPGMVSNCDAFYRIVTGDSCDSIASKNGISVAQLASWNSVGGTACNGLWANTYICVSIIGHTPTPTNPGNGISTPSPIQDGMTRNCKTFHRVVAGDSCATIASRYRITTAQFISWNPAARSDCTGLWANTYACVAVL